MYDKPISYSGKSLYDQCPRKWHSAYILGQREPPHPKAERGVQYHAILEDFFNGKIAYPVADKVLAPWTAYMTHLFALGAEYMGRAEGEIACDEEWQPMAFDDPSAYARGKKDYDYRVPQEDVLHLKDWKTGRIYDDHVKQGQFYAAISPPAELVIPEFVYLDHPLVTKSWEYDRAEVQEIRKELADQIAIIRHDEKWSPTPGDHCRWCKKNWRFGGDCTAAP